MSQDKQMKAVSPLLQQVINISSIVGGGGSLIFCIWAYQAGILQSKETLSAFIQQAGIWGPALFIFLQILQTVVPIIPGALTSVAGVFIYGHIIGTIYNYIGIVIGCAIIFYLVRLYGAAFVQSVVSKRTYDKYIGWLDKGNRFDRFFIFMMIWPISPADFLCMLAAVWFPKRILCFILKLLLQGQSSQVWQNHFLRLLASRCSHARLVPVGNH